MLYQHELTSRPVAELASEQGDGPFTVPECPQGVDDYELSGAPLSEYARALAVGVERRREEIDAQLSEVAENWTIERMPVVDRNIIRVAAFEIAFRDEIPTGVAINEAVEVAKLYGGDESPKFVNGVLGRIAARHDGASASAAGAGTETGA